MFKLEQKSINRKSDAFIHSELEIGEQNDENEQEANAVTDKVMCMNDGNDNIQPMKDPDNCQPMLDSPVIQKKPTSAKSGINVPKTVESGIYQSKGGGQNLSPNVQKEMGEKMNADFSGVKIHTDDNAAKMNNEIGAKAFAMGSDIYFNKGLYSPYTQSGKHLLAHELVHTIQQSAKIQRETNDFGTKGLKGLPESDRKQMDITTGRRTGFGNSLAELFNLSGSKYYDVNSEHGKALESNVSFFNIDYQDYLGQGLKNLANTLIDSPDPAYQENPNELSVRPPEKEYSDTILLDFTSDHPNLDSLITEPVDKSPEAEKKRKVRGILTSKEIFRFSFNGQGVNRNIYIEDLGSGLKVGGDEQKGKNLFNDSSVAFHFVDNAVLSNPDETDPVRTISWGDGNATKASEEKNKVYASLSRFPASVLSGLNGMRFFRAKIASDDIKYKRASANPSAYVPRTQAEYIQSDHAIVVYDVAITGNAINVYGDQNAGFSTVFEQTIAHEIGHVVDLNALRTAGTKEKEELDLNKSKSDLAYKKQNDAVLAYQNSLKPKDNAFNAANIAFIDYQNTELIPLRTSIDDRYSKDYFGKLSTLFDAKKAKYNNSSDQNERSLLKDELDALNMLGSGITAPAGGIKLGNKVVLPEGTVVLGFSELYNTNTRRYRPRTEFDNTMALLSAISGTEELQSIMKEIFDQIDIYNATADFRDAIKMWIEGDGAAVTVNPKSANQNKAIALVNFTQAYVDLKKKTSELNDAATTANEEIKTADANYSNALIAYKTAMTTERSKSGYGYSIEEDNTNNSYTFTMTEDETSPTDGGDSKYFRNAAKADFQGNGEIDRITAYSDKNWREFYAETFSYYFTDPERLSALRPNVYKYFESNFGIWKDKY